MPESRESRAQRLALRISEVLERGVDPDTVRAELVRRGMKPQPAADMVALVVEQRRREAADRKSEIAAVAEEAALVIDALWGPANTTTPPPEPTPPTSPKRPTFAIHTAPARLPFLRFALTHARQRLVAVGLIFLVSNGTLWAVQTMGAKEREETALRLAGEVDAARTDIARMEAELDVRKRQAADLDSLRLRVRRGPIQYASLRSYRADVAHYERSLSTWNVTLPFYRGLAEQYRAQIAFHNMKVDSLAAVSRRLSRARLARLPGPPQPLEERVSALTQPM